MGTETQIHSFANAMLLVCYYVNFYTSDSHSQSPYQIPCHNGRIKVQGFVVEKAFPTICISMNVKKDEKGKHYIYICGSKAFP